MPPNSDFPNCDSGTVAGNTLQNPGFYGITSHHSGGANVLMLDGSVRWLKDSTNMQIIWGLGSRDQGEIISSDAF